MFNRYFRALLLILFFCASPHFVLSQPESSDIIDLKEMEMADVLKLMSLKTGLNVVATPSVKGKISIYLKGVEMLEALKIIADTNGWAVSQQDKMVTIMTQTEFEEKFGYKFAQDYQTKVRQLKYATTADILAVLNQVKSTAGKIITDEKSKVVVLMDKPGKIVEMEQVIDQIDVAVKTEVYTLNYAKAEDISPKVTELLTPNLGQMKFDARSNKIIVTDSAVNLDKIRRMINEFDQRDSEVLIKAKIVQVTLSDQNRLGINWEKLIDDYHQLNLKSNFDILKDTDKRGQFGIGTLSNEDYKITLHALETIGHTQIISSPSVAAVNNKEAKILIGSTEPYVTTTTTTPADGPATTAESVTFLDVGVKLYVTPTIHNDGFITMKIKPEVSSVVRNLVTSNNNTIPILATSQAETTVFVKDNVTIAIGGLIKEDNIRTRNQVPVLGDIPYLGNIFKNDDQIETKTETVIFLTPSIISGDAAEKIEQN